MKTFCFFSLVIFSEVLWASELGHLSIAEQNDVNSRLKDFYHFPFVAEAMNRNGIQYSPQLGKKVELHPELKSFETIPDSSFVQQAQKKNNLKYKKWYCINVLKKISPHFPCEEERFWSGFEKEDRVSDLAKTWLDKVFYSMDELPSEGKSISPLWSDDYWPMVRGLTSYRYSTGTWFSDYWEAIQSYFQPQEWVSLKESSTSDKEKAILSWAPSEKYDLSVKDELFSLTQQQKKEGERYQDENGEVESWMGLCHGWAPAAIMVSRPEYSVDWRGPESVAVKWYPNDIKALITLAWANGFWESNFVGRRCEQKEVQFFQNGRIKTGDCFDNNPATFHLALANLVGMAQGSFVMDKAYDYRVWNQPIVSYDFTFFNPSDFKKKSKNWKEVAVKYDKKFKKKDRFQKPLTRGKFKEGRDLSSRRFWSSQQDAHIDQVVGVVATVEYLVESVPAEFGPRPGEDFSAREVYLYDLELMEEGGQWLITGGEWYQNNHPDFLFVPQKGTQPSHYWDKFDIELDPNSLSSDAQSLTVIQQASEQGYPLHQVIQHLINASTLPQSRSK